MSKRLPLFFKHAVFLILTTVAPLATAQEVGLNSLKPIMNVPDQVVYQSDFAKNQPLEKKQWQARQGTQWKVVDGVLKGTQSSPEFQAKKKDHKGLEPRIKSLKTPRQFIAKFSVRFIGGTETTLLPIIEFGHHNVRLKFSESGVVMLADHESIKLASTKLVKLELGKWHHLLAERRGDEFVVQFADGPTLYAKHKSLAIPVADDSDGLGIAGTRLGIVEIDNLSLSSIKATSKTKDWKTIQKKLGESASAPIKIEKKKKKKR